MIKDHEQVVLTTSVPAEGLESGDVGTVIQIYEDGRAYEVEFTDDRDVCLFIATVHRKEIVSSEKILALLKADPELAAREIADTLGITQRAVEKQISKLREEGRIRRIGPDKGGHWEVV